MGKGRVTAYNPVQGTEKWWTSGLFFQIITLPVTGHGLLLASAAGTGDPRQPVKIPQWQELLKYDRNNDGVLKMSEVPQDAGIQIRKEVSRDFPGNVMPIRFMMKVRADGNKNGEVTKKEWQRVLDFARASRDTLLAIRPGGSGDISQSHVVWKAHRGLSEVPTPLIYRDRIYFVRNGGMVSSYDLATGKLVLDRKRLGAGGHYVASPILADGQIYAASDSGRVVVFRAADQLEVLARNDLHEKVLATPGVADDTLYVRTEKHLWAFGHEAEIKP